MELCSLLIPELLEETLSVTRTAKKFIILLQTFIAQVLVLLPTAIMLQVSQHFLVIKILTYFDILQR